MNAVDWECLSDCTSLLHFWQQFQQNESRQLKPLFLDFNGKSGLSIYPNILCVPMFNFTKPMKQFCVSGARAIFSQNICRRHKKDRTNNGRSNFSSVSGKGLVCYKCISVIKSSHSLQTFITTLLQFSCAILTIQRVSHISHFRRSGKQKKDEQEIKFLQTRKKRYTQFCVWQSYGTK